MRVLHFDGKVFRAGIFFAHARHGDDEKELSSNMNCERPAAIAGTLSCCVQTVFSQFETLGSTDKRVNMHARGTNSLCLGRIDQ